MTRRAIAQAARTGKGAWWLGVALAVAGRPRLWRVALVESLAMVPRRWWRRWPPVPVPSPAWLAFRMETAYGDASARPSAQDVVAWLKWCELSRRQARLR